MAKIEVSAKPVVVTRIATRMIGLLVAGRVMLNDPNLLYVLLSSAYFVSLLVATITWIMYAQWRAREGWVNEIDIPDNDLL